MHELIAGLSHLLHGGDHLLAMLAVGFWGARYAGRLRWVLPAAFVGFMGLGASSGMPLPYLEPMIALSLLVLGLATVVSVRCPLFPGAAVVALFALFHGHAHFAELPAGASLARFVSGMLLATAALHIVGLGMALGLGRIGAWLPRALGGAVSLAGAWLLLTI